MSTGPLVVLMGDVAPTSLVAQQLQLRSFFSLRLKNRLYFDDLGSATAASAPPLESVKVILGADSPTLGQVVQGLNRVAPSWRERDSLLFFPAALYFVDPSVRSALLLKAMAATVSFALRFGGLALRKLSVAQISTRNAELRLADVPVDLSQDLDADLVDLNAATGLWQVETIHTSARSFNAFSTELPYVLKTSSNVAKARDEYDYFCQAPAALRAYLPQVGTGGTVPSGYAYQIEFVPMLDLSRFVIHGSLRAEPDGAILLAEIGKVLDATASRPTPLAQVQEALSELFIHKLERRMAELRALPIYADFLTAIASLCPQGLDGLTDQLIAALTECIAATPMKPRLVFGHGDLCFSNILYDRLSGRIKLIDPRGLSCAYMPEYYDLAKLSHSVLGNYDFIINDMHSYFIDPQLRMNCRAHVPDPVAHADFQAYFRSWCKARGYSLRLIRLGEASLFLSMLPLHSDHPARMVAQVCAARDILAAAQA